MPLYPKYQDVFDEHLSWSLLKHTLGNIHLESAGLDAPENLKWCNVKGVNFGNKIHDSGTINTNKVVAMVIGTMVSASHRKKISLKMTNTPSIGNLLK